MLSIGLQLRPAQRGCLQHAESQKKLAVAVLFDTMFYLLCAEDNLLKDKTCEQKFM